MSDWFARSMTAFFRFFADEFFARRYGHRADGGRYVGSLKKLAASEDRVWPDDT